jgi:hypothetical protein
MVAGYNLPDKRISYRDLHIKLNVEANTSISESFATRDQ